MIFEFPHYNLHTHSYYCGHGVGTLKEYVDFAKNNDISLLGFSEHCPLKNNRWSNTRMSFNSIKSYLNCINNLKILEDDIVILSGFECDYNKEYYNYFNKLQQSCDYLIFGVHFLENNDYKDVSIDYYDLSKKDLIQYANQYIEAIGTGLFKIGVHTDLFLNRYHIWDEETKAVSKDIIEAAIDKGVALEINGKGMLKDKVIGFKSGYRYSYPVKEFWELAAQYDNLKIVSNSDAHSPFNLIKTIDRCRSFIKEMNINLAKVEIDINNFNKSLKIV